MRYTHGKGGRGDDIEEEPDHGALLGEPPAGWKPTRSQRKTGIKAFRRRLCDGDLSAIDDLIRAAERGNRRAMQEFQRLVEQDGIISGDADDDSTNRDGAGSR